MRGKMTKIVVGKIKRQVTEMYETGEYTHQEIARAFGLTYAAVCSFYNKNKFTNDFPQVKRKRKYDVIGLVADYKEGKLSHQQIAKKNRVSYQYANDFYNSFRTRYDFPLKRKQKWEEGKKQFLAEVDAAYTLYLSVSSLRRVAVVYGVSRQYVGKVFKKNKLRTRRK
jgi:DNA invertase Pin-like site-specific DNA recombinase